MSSDLATLQAHLTDLEQENERLRSRLQSCEQAHGVLQAEVAAWQQQQQDWQEQRAIAREQEQAAQERAAELTKANTALQRVIDALTEIDDLDEFVPATLRIVAQTFETENCAFYEHSDNALIYLRYWLMGDRVLRPDDLITLDSERFAAVRRLAEGFTVPDAYLGTPVRDRARAVILDHTCDTSDPEFDQFACKNGWATELNVPLMVDGYAEGALVIYRSTGTTYTPAEIGLAEALGKQLALAMQASRLATEKRSQAVETAIAREQKQAAQERVATLERVQFVLQRSTERLSAATDPKAIIVEILRTAAEVLAPLGVKGIGLMSYQPASRTVRVKAHITNDLEQTIAGSDLDGDWSVDSPAMVIPWQRLQTENFVWGLTSDTSVLIAEVRQYHGSLGARAIAYIPLRQEEETTGWIGFNLASEIPPTLQQIEMIQALTNQIVLAAEMDRLAEIAREAAIAREQEKAAQERAAELAKANEVLWRSLRSLAANQSLDHFLGDVLASLAEQFDSTTAEYWFHREGTTAYIDTMIWGGKLYTRDEIVKQFPEHPGVEGYRVPPELIFGEPLNRRTKHFVIEHFPTHPIVSTIAWMPSQGLYKEINVPLNVGERTIGALIVRLRQDFEITTQKIELAWALANQVALALELTRLAEEAKQAAIAREQEKAAQERVAELTKANEALKQTVDVLATETDLDRYLGQVLRVIAEQFEAPLAEYWYHPEPHNLAYIGLTYWQGQILRPEEQPGHVGSFGYPVPPEMIQQESLHQRRNHFVTEDMATSPVHIQIGNDYGLDAGAWYRSRGMSSFLNVPLILGDKTIGALIVFFPKSRPFTEQQIELAHALAQQVTLAIQLTRLAEETKQAEVAEAIAREQEQAAQQQAAELSKANILLRNSLSRSSTTPNLQDVLGHLLIELVEYAGAAVGHLFSYDLTQATLNLNVRCQGDQAFWTPADDEPAVFRSPVPLAQAPTFTQLCIQPQLAILNQDQFEGKLWQGCSQWVQAKGYQGICGCVLMVGDRPLGMLAMAFPQPITFRPVEEELILALAQQIALVLQLTELGEADKQMAIAREQEKAAQERATELERVNTLLRDSLAQLSQQSDVNTFLGQVAGEILQHLNAANVFILRYSPADHTLCLCLFHYGSRLRWGTSDEELALFAAPFSASITPAFEIMCRERRMFTPSTYAAFISIPIEEFAFPGGLEWMERINASDSAITALFAGDQPIGSIHVQFTNGQQMRQEDEAFFLSLTQQAAITLRIADLAEKAQQAAIAREQEKAAQQRATELAKANEVLRQSLNTLVVEQTLPGYLSHVLISITHQLNAASSVLWLYDQEQRRANLSLVFNGQTVKPASQTHHPNARTPRDYSSPERLHAWEAISQQRQSDLLVIAEETRMTPPQRDYLLRQGIWGILSIPLVLGDRTEGTFAIHFHAPRQFRDEELELVQTLANQAALAIQMAQLAEQAKDAALLEERNRLAGEIHDTLAQAFTGISMQLSVAKWLLQQDPNAVDHILDRINDIAQGGLAEARRSVWTLYPVEPAYADLAQQLSRCVKQMTSGTAMQVDVQISGSPCPLSPLVGKNLLRIGQEAITNTLKHAQATVLKIHLTYTEATLCLCLQDNGHGFLTDSDHTGFGLISMSDRADRIGGQLTINSQLGQGTETKIQVPLP